MLRGDTTREEFGERRRARDAQLPAPVLLYPSLQVNIRGGHLPPAQPNGLRYLSAPAAGRHPGRPGLNQPPRAERLTAPAQRAKVRRLA